MLTQEQIMKGLEEVTKTFDGCSYYIHLFEPTGVKSMDVVAYVNDGSVKRESTGLIMQMIEALMMANKDSDFKDWDCAPKSKEWYKGAASISRFVAHRFDQLAEGAQNEG